MRIPRVRRLLIAALLVLPATVATASDGEAVLRFRDGRLVAGKVRELRTDGVLHESDRGTVFWRWEDLTPFSRYEVRAAVLDEDDGPGRLALARLCLDEGLPAEARREVLRARGLGAGEPADLDALVSACDRAEAEAAFSEVDRLSAAGDLDGAIEALKAYLVRAPASEWTERARERASELVRRRELDAERRRIEAERLKSDRARDTRARAIADTMEQGDRLRTEGSRAALIGIREEPGGSITRFLAALDEAAVRYLEARRLYERARRTAGNDGPVESRAALEARRGVEARLLDVYLRLARSHVAHKRWKEAQAALDKALRLDPVNPEGLDLQETVSKNWIRRKASELTNASGHSSDGTGK